MKKTILIICITILSYNCYSQVVFEKGYFINNSDEKVECQIKNVDWKNNPSKFEYKLSENTEPKTIGIESVKEFAIIDKVKFIRDTVNIDRSSEVIYELSYDRAPEFKEELLFLKVLVEGDANLYYYEDKNLKRYFYNVNNSKIEQLIFKSYRSLEDAIIRENITFRQQLWSKVKCPAYSLNRIERLNYKRKPLFDYFVAYNKHIVSDFEIVKKKRDKNLFNLNIRPGLNVSMLSIENPLLGLNKNDFDPVLGFRFGLEAEFILPFNKNKWAIIVEPTFQYYKSESKTTSLFSNGYTNMKVDYNSIELPIGLRYSFFLNNSSKLFIDASFVADFAYNSSIEVSNNYAPEVLDISSLSNWAVGCGYTYKDKYSVSIRYQIDREILNDYISWRSSYNIFSVVVGYSLF